MTYTPSLEALQRNKAEQTLTLRLELLQIGEIRNKKARGAITPPST